MYGYINRIHPMRKFGISVPQAAMDLQRFMRGAQARWRTIPAPSATNRWSTPMTRLDENDLRYLRSLVHMDLRSHRKAGPSTGKVR